MQEYYLLLRMLHISCVSLSGLLFLLRGIGLHGFGAHWPMAAPVRYASYTIDTVLLASAILLTTIINQYPLVDNWLTVKVGLVILYILLGIFGLKRGKTKRTRILCFLAALAVYGVIIIIAVTKHPMGILYLV